MLEYLDSSGFLEPKSGTRTPTLEVTAPIGFGGGYHPFREVLSVQVGLYTTACVYLGALHSVRGGRIGRELLTCGSWPCSWLS
jgi:hypothetical protein